MPNMKKNHPATPKFAKRILTVAVAGALMSYSSLSLSSVPTAVYAGEDGAYAAAAAGETANAWANDAVEDTKARSFGDTGSIGDADPSLQAGAAASSTASDWSDDETTDAEAESYTDMGVTSTSGTILTNSSTVLVEAYAGPSTSSSAAAAATAINTISGEVVVSSGSKIVLDADSRVTADAEADGYDDSDNGVQSVDNTALAYSSSAAASYSAAIIGGGNEDEGNTVVNNGTIDSNDSGILLSAQAASIAIADSYSYVDTDGDIGWSDDWYTEAGARSASAALAGIGGNSVENNGTIFAEDFGIRLLASAYARDSANAYSEYGDESYYSDSFSTATAGIINNGVSNSGNIVVNDGTGIELLAVAADPEDSYPYTLDNAQAAVVMNTVTNNGLIAVSGDTYPSDGGFFSTLDGGGAGAGADGIRIRAYARATDDLAVVVGNKVFNNGRIYAEDDGIEMSASDGPFDSGYDEDTLSAAVQGNLIENNYSARIVAGDVGINLSGDWVQDNEINNSGLIVSDPGMEVDGTDIIKSAQVDWDANNATAIRVVGYSDDSFGYDYEFANRLNLSAPAYLAGRILLQNTADVLVSMTSGPSHSVRWAIQNDGFEGLYSQEDQSGYILEQSAPDGDYSYARAALGGPVPWFVNEIGFEALNVPSEADPLDKNGVINDIYATIDPTAFSAAGNVLADMTGSISSMLSSGGMNLNGKSNGLWLSVQAGKMDYDGDKVATLDNQVRVETAAIGYTRDLGAARLGVMAGYAKTNLDVGSLYGDLYNHSYENESAGAFAGIYASTSLGMLNIGVGVSAGMMSHDDKRFINDNLDWWGISYATATYDSTWYSPEISLSLPIAMGDSGWNFGPNVNYRYASQSIDGYTEKGSDADATVASRDIAMGELRAGLNLTKAAGKATFSAKVGYFQRDALGDDKVRVNMIGDQHDVPFFESDLNGGYAGIDINMALTDNVDLTLKGDYVNADNASGGSVNGTLKIKF